MPAGVGYGPYSARPEEQQASAPRPPMPPMPEGMGMEGGGMGMMSPDAQGLPAPPSGDDQEIIALFQSLPPEQQARLFVEFLMNRGKGGA